MWPPTTAVRAVSVLAVLALLGACGNGTSQTQAAVVVHAPGTDARSITTVTTTSPGPAHPDSVPVQVFGTPLDSVTWSASAWQAATPAILIAGRIPHGPTVAFDVPDTPGPPSRPASDAMLAVAALAALRGDRLRTDATLLADVAPNGGLLPVTRPAAMRGQLDVGAVRVMVPEPDLETLEQAYGVLTHDGVVDRTSPDAPPADPELVELLIIATEQIIDQVRAAAAAQPVTADGRSRRRDLLTAATTATTQLRAGRPYAAYSTVTLAQQQAAMADAASAATDRLQRERRLLTRDLAALQRRADDRMDLAASTPLNHVEQYPALADALTWASGTLGILNLAERDLRAATNRGQLAAVAANLARCDYRLRTYLPLQVEAVQQVGQVRAQDPQQILTALADFATQLGETAAARRSQDPGAAAARAGAQLRVWRAMPRDDTEQEPTLSRLAAALSAYIASANADLSQGNVTVDLFARQIEVASQQNDVIAATAAEAGFDPSFIAWGDEWGRSWAAPHPGTTVDEGTRATGLTYQWYAAVQGRILISLAQRT